MNNELVPDKYDYTKLFGLWKGKGSKLDLNMTRYIHGKEWDAKFLEAPSHIISPSKIHSSQVLPTLHYITDGSARHTFSSVKDTFITSFANST